MNLLDLFNMGIEVEMNKDELTNLIQDAVIFRFRKGDQEFKRIITNAEILRFNGGTRLLGDLISSEAMGINVRVTKDKDVIFDFHNGDNHIERFVSREELIRSYAYSLEDIICEEAIQHFKNNPTAYEKVIQYFKDNPD